MPNIGDLISANDLGKKIKKQKRIYVWLDCPDCGKERWVRKNYEDNPTSGRCRACGNKHYKEVKAKKMEEHGMWNGGRHVRGDGYVNVKLSKDDFFYPMAGRKDYVLEHRLIMAKHLNRCLLPWEVVHHKNGVKNDNRLENLQLLPEGRWHLVDTVAKQYIKKLEAELAMKAGWKSPEEASPEIKTGGEVNV